MIWNITAAAFFKVIGIRICLGGNTSFGLLNVGIGVLYSLSVIAKIIV